MYMPENNFHCKLYATFIYSDRTDVLIDVCSEIFILRVYKCSIIKIEFLFYKNYFQKYKNMKNFFMEYSGNIYELI